MNRSTTNQAPRTPPENHEHYFTPASLRGRAKVRGAVEFCERMGIPCFKEDVFSNFQSFAHSRPFRAESSSRRLYNDLNREETRGWPRIISANKIREMERILQEEGIETRVRTWQQLGFEVGLECIGETVKKALGGSIDYRNAKKAESMKRQVGTGRLGQRS